jgi:hypothetical protein
MEAHQTMSSRSNQLSLYVDRNLPSCWIVRDRHGDFWMVPPGECAWDRRQPYTLTEGAKLELVPNHYKYLLGIGG